MGWEQCMSLPVTVVLFAIFLIYYVNLFLLIDPWLGLSTAPGLLNACTFTFWAVMALISYALAILRDPGSVPKQYVPDLEDGEATIQEVKRKGGSARYCQKCNHYKPPRAHHCRICKRCVLRMDHHCVWINNCVGHSNYKSFFLFVVYLVAGLTHTLVLLGGHALFDQGERGGFARTASDSPSGTNSVLSSFLRVVSLVTAAPLLLALGLLLSWHVYLLSCNKTTIEYHEGVRAKWLAAKVGEDYKHPYDLGLVNNMFMILGPNAVCWLCPVSLGHLGLGVRFTTAFDDKVRKAASWVGEGAALSKDAGNWLT